ncbi:hypothetical protein GXM_08574 [Nostoc sphaeroides CCNUC1]|uniref:Uncharacterized protein n=1 Tax=Nostoc sphaeroides CCNUC1 TaxID=2653204 RepID=A0A5P8WEQ8_9NOSO|nr:hypothetical protein GXM_08574 [Nostoc sphaeroides CCNUC1]
MAINPQTINPLTLPSAFPKKPCLRWAMTEQLSTTSKVYVLIDSEKILLN